MGQAPVPLGMKEDRIRFQKAACTCCFKRADEHQLQMSSLHPRRRMDVFNTSQAPGRPMVRTGPCILCREASADTVCLPCGHLLVCFRCSRRYYIEDRMHPDTRCPVCKQTVQHFQRALLQSQTLQAERRSLMRT
ncbi:unnamed protein product [Effrenium voratum]|nr:unnamed protein product [Effrenium voratum]